MPTSEAPPRAVIEDRWLQVFGRLKPGATLADAQHQAGAVATQRAAYPGERKNAYAQVRTGGDRAKDVTEMVSAMVFVMAVPVILLLVACANLANQLLARAIQRGREIAVRLSLGATRGRVVRQLLVETAPPLWPARWASCLRAFSAKLRAVYLALFPHSDRRAGAASRLASRCSRRLRPHGLRSTFW